MSVHKKLMQARLALQSTELKKSGFNKFAAYYYFELGDFLPQTQVIFNELGLCGIVSYAQDVATLTITDTEDGSSIQITSPMSTAALKGCHEVQNLGAVETYIRRYLWVTAMEIVEHDAIYSTTKTNNASKTDSKGSKAGEVQPMKHTPNDGALDEFSEEEIVFLKDSAQNITELFSADGMEEAMTIYDSLDNDEKRGLWSFLESNVRAAIKKICEERKEK